MYRVKVAVPMVKACIRSSQPVRNFWHGPHMLDVRGMIKDMERGMVNFERSVFGDNSMLTPGWKRMPIDGADVGYKINVDLQGFTPEDIKIALEKGMLKISAEQLQMNEDGSKFRQSIVREYKLPENLDQASLKSYFHKNGFLSIEGMMDNMQEAPNEIPIRKTEENKEKNIN